MRSAILLLLLCSCTREEHHEPVKSMLAPLGPAPALDARVVDLGRALYHDPLLSKNGAVSCATCHPLATGGTTRDQLNALGFNGKPAAYNTPTIFNATLQPTQAWRGDAADIPTLLERPFFRPSCMGNDTWEDMLARMEPRYPGVTKEQVNASLVAYMEHVTPRDAPFDRWLTGDDNAIDGEAKKGAALFASVGCIACHNGRGVGGTMMTPFGIASDPYASRGQCDDGSYCRADSVCTCTTPAPVREQDRGNFRVPSLRNVELTAPYLHDGSARTLDETVRVMAQHQLGRTLNEGEVEALVAFLRTLTADLPDEEITLAEREARMRRGAKKGT